MWQMSSLYPGWACRGQTTAKLVISPRGALSTWAFTSGSRAKRLFWPLLQRPALAGAACFHATADSERLDIRQMGFAQPVAVIPNGIDIPEPCFRAETHPRTLLYLGRLHRVKGLDLLLAAWAELQDRFPEWRLKIVGSDLGYHGRTGYECQLRSLATSLKLVRLEFAGELRGSDKLMAYREAQLFVLPSRSENFGIAVAEALAAGTPALVSKGAPWHGLEANGCGWWVDLDKVALIDGLAKAMSLSPDELKKMGQLGREWMSHDFSWPHIGNMMRQTYDWLAGRTPPPAFVRFD
jgi:glycosyltransferase involved in cell wall biosynthesis